MLEPEIAALDHGAVDHLGAFVESSLVLLRISRNAMASPRAADPRPRDSIPDRSERRGMARDRAAFAEALRDGPAARVPMREILNGIFYVATGGLPVAPAAERLTRRLLAGRSADNNTQPRIPDSPAGALQETVFATSKPRLHQLGPFSFSPDVANALVRHSGVDHGVRRDSLQRLFELIKMRFVLRCPNLARKRHGTMSDLSP